MQLPAAGVPFDMAILLAVGALFKSHEALGAEPITLPAKSAWFRCSTALQAALSLVGLFNSAWPPARLSPLGLVALRRAAEALLDGRIYGGPSSPAHHEKLELLLRVLRSS